MHIHRFPPYKMQISFSLFFVINNFCAVIFTEYDKVYTIKPSIIYSYLWLFFFLSIMASPFDLLGDETFYSLYHALIHALAVFFFFMDY
jgi:NADH:ubiquinone oxidoreductase subunit 6 (subunit J)